MQNRLTLGLCALSLCAIFWASPSTAQISENVTLLSNVDDFGGYNDVWGYTAPNGDEYAILGTTSATVFYNVTDPANPVQVGLIDGPDSTWRDMKTYGTYSYSVTEGSSPGSQAGIQVVSLVDPENPTLVNTIQGDFVTCHNIFIDTDEGHAYAVGTDSGTLVYDLSVDPINPPLIGQPNIPYVHDIYVKNGIAYAAHVYDGTCNIYNVANQSNWVQLSSFTSPGFATHNTWANDDQTVLVTSDETSGGHLNFWDVSDPQNPQPLDNYVAGSGASAHNAFFRGDLVYVSYYTEGMRVISVADPSDVSEVGYYDTFQGSGLYAGDWGVYPFATEAGIAYVSDMSNGLFVLRFSADFGTLSGTVTDAATLAPIAGATVDVPGTGQTRTTGPSGTFSVPLDPGNYTVDAAAFGYASDSAPATITTGQTTVVDFALNRLPNGQLSGTVSSGGTPINGAAVELENTPLGETTDASGQYAFPNVPEDSYMATANAFRYAPLTLATSVTAGQSTTLDFDLVPAISWTELESDPGWTVQSTSSTGRWVRVDPNGTGGGTIQPEDDHTPAPGTHCYVTGQGSVGGSIGENDVDDGSTVLTTSAYDLSQTADPYFQYHRWYVNDGNGSVDDVWVVEISADGNNWVTVENTGDAAAEWLLVDVRVREFLPEPTGLGAVQMRFTASDLGAGSIVEAGVDDFMAYNAEPPSTGIDTPAPAPAPAFRVLGNFPNPFNPTTEIRFETSAPGAVALKVFDLQGRLVRTLVEASLQSGSHQVGWDGRNQHGTPMASGIYFYRLEAAGQVQAERMVLAK